jgi:hypothetical protein
MFQYACARALALDLDQPLGFSLDAFKGYGAHNGFELERVFGLDLNIIGRKEIAAVIGRARAIPIVRRALARPQLSPLAGRNFIVEPHFSYWPALRERAKHGGYLQGYWQSERYFAGHEACIRSEFSFPTELQGENAHVAQLIKQRPSISVHVRRGDYVSNAKTLSVHGVCSVDYYTKSIDTLKQRHPDARLFAFSDDPQWVAEVLKPRYSDLVIVRHNKGQASFNDMRLMSLCQHHVIANSSFSWWAAWLNPSPQKTVIAPANWFAAEVDTRDLIPSNWERI